jgi:hypothetical protein
MKCDEGYAITGDRDAGCIGGELTWELVEFTCAKKVELTVGLSLDDGILAFKTKFKEMLSGVLEIEADRIVVLNVKGGSAIVKFHFAAHPDQQAHNTPEALMSKLQAMYENGELAQQMPSVLSFDAAPDIAGPSVSASATNSASTAEPDDDSALLIVFVLISIMVCAVLVVVAVVMYHKTKGKGEEQDVTDEIEMETTQNPITAGSAGPVLTPPAAGVELWRSVVDPNSGRTYYVNKDTKETSWELPAAMATQQQTWREHIDPQGRTYYSNKATKETAWALPPGATVENNGRTLEL